MRSMPNPSGSMGEEARLARDPGYVSATHKHASYMARGNYARQLERWFDDFPREQILVIRSEDLVRANCGSFTLVAEFPGHQPGGHDPIHDAQRNFWPSPRSLDPSSVITALCAAQRSIGRSARLGSRLELTALRYRPSSSPLTPLCPVCHGCRV